MEKDDDPARSQQSPFQTLCSSPIKKRISLSSCDLVLIYKPPTDPLEGFHQIAQLLEKYFVFVCISPHCHVYIVTTGSWNVTVAIEMQLHPRTVDHSRSIATMNSVRSYNYL